MNKIIISILLFTNFICWTAENNQMTNVNNDETVYIDINPEDIKHLNNSTPQKIVKYLISIFNMYKKLQSNVDDEEIKEQMAEFISDFNININLQDAKGNTPLIVARKACQYQLAEILVMAGAPDLNAIIYIKPEDVKRLNSSTPQKLIQYLRRIFRVHKIMQPNRSDKEIKGQMVRYISDFKINVELKDFEGNTPLNIARLLGQDQLAEILLMAGAMPDLNLPNPHQTILNNHCPEKLINYLKYLFSFYKASKSGITEEEIRNHIIQLISKNNINVDIIDECGNTPLHVACKLGDYELVKILLLAHANPNYESKCEMYYIAKSPYKKMMLERLGSLNPGKKIKIINLIVKNWLPIHEALYAGYFEIVELLANRTDGFKDFSNFNPGTLVVNYYCDKTLKCEEISVCDIIHNYTGNAIKEINTLRNEFGEITSNLKDVRLKSKNLESNNDVGPDILKVPATLEDVINSYLK